MEICFYNKLVDRNPDSKASYLIRNMLSHKCIEWASLSVYRIYQLHFNICMSDIPRSKNMVQQAYAMSQLRPKLCTPLRQYNKQKETANRKNISPADDLTCPTQIFRAHSLCYISHVLLPVFCCMLSGPDFIMLFMGSKFEIFLHISYPWRPSYFSPSMWEVDLHGMAQDYY